MIKKHAPFSHNLHVAIIKITIIYYVNTKKIKTFLKYNAKQNLENLEVQRYLIRYIRTYIPIVF